LKVIPLEFVEINAWSVLIQKKNKKKKPIDHQNFTFSALQFLLLLANKVEFKRFISDKHHFGGKE
jgi:hypothetical protein